MKELTKKERAVVAAAGEVFTARLVDALTQLGADDGPLSSFTDDDRQNAFDFVATRTCGAALGNLLRNMVAAGQAHGCSPEAHAHIFWHTLYAAIGEGWSPDGSEPIPWCEPTCDDGPAPSADAKHGLVH